MGGGRKKIYQKKKDEYKDIKDKIYIEKYKNKYNKFLE